MPTVHRDNMPNDPAELDSAFRQVSFGAESGEVCMDATEAVVGPNRRHAGGRSRRVTWCLVVVAVLSLGQATAEAVEVHGHRGARGLWPENSLRAFAAALSIGVDVLELDVVLTKDGQLAVSHDPAPNPGRSTHRHSRR